MLCEYWKDQNNVISGNRFKKYLGNTMLKWIGKRIKIILQQRKGLKTTQFPDISNITTKKHTFKGKKQHMIIGTWSYRGRNQVYDTVKVKDIE